ncbi:MAG: acyl-CoA thioesterase, partial [Sandaracinaceae bacterium]|nr:acyl-CoA thioesterase [Sandaracinaceae bacterium]
HHGLDYRAWEERTKLGMPVVEAHLKYRSPARFDDLLDVETWVAECTRAKIVFESTILRGDELLAEAAITVVCVDMIAERIVSVPEEVKRACLERHGAG